MPHFRETSSNARWLISTPEAAATCDISTVKVVAELQSLSLPGQSIFEAEDSFSLPQSTMHFAKLSRGRKISQQSNLASQSSQLQDPSESRMNTQINKQHQPQTYLTFQDPTDSAHISAVLSDSEADIDSVSNSSSTSSTETYKDDKIPATSETGTAATTPQGHDDEDEDKVGLMVRESVISDLEKIDELPELRQPKTRRQRMMDRNASAFPGCSSWGPQ